MAFWHEMLKSFVIRIFSSLSVKTTLASGIVFFSFYSFEPIQEFTAAGDLLQLLIVDHIPFIHLFHNIHFLSFYGGIVYRSIGYITYQNRNVFEPGTEEHNYIWAIIHYVYGHIYDDAFRQAWTPHIMFLMTLSTL